MKLNLSNWFLTTLILSVIFLVTLCIDTYVYPIYGIEKTKIEETEEPVKLEATIQKPAIPAPDIKEYPEPEPEPDPQPVEILSYSEKEILAKLLYREAGSMSWEGQVYVCSAILNLRDHTGKTIWEMAHKVNMFSVAPIVDSAKPRQMQYEVIDYVLHGGRIPGIKYFRTNHYHRFGTPVCKIQNVYFSK